MPRQGVDLSGLSKDLPFYPCHARVNVLPEIWFQKMCDNNFSPDLIAYNSFISACAGKGDVPQAEALLREAGARRLSPNLVTYNAVLHAAARSSTREAGAIACMLLAACIPLRVVLAWPAKGVAVELPPAWRSQDLQKAKEYLGRLQSAIGPDIVSFNCILHACARLSQVAEAERTLRSLKQSLQPNLISFNAMISVHCKAPKQR